ncbi:MAG: AraC family transcriptional regulator N-terminal domain-containing protein [Brevinema sp.]
MNTELERLEHSSELLRQKIKAYLPYSEIKETGIPGFTIIRRNESAEGSIKFISKAITISILDGYKQSILGSKKLSYGKNQTMVTGIDMICSSRIDEASPENPYLAITLELDYSSIGELMQEVNFPEIKNPIQQSMAVSQSDSNIIDAYSRLIDLLSLPEDQQKVLAPMIIREIHFRLLTGELGEQLRMLHTNGCTSNRIAKAASWIREHFAESFKVEDLAAKVFMAPSSFYRNFNKVTSVSPIKYQKQIRLYEARRLILGGEDVISAAYQVGYESSTQFHKEYKRMFGAPPKVDAKNFMLNN